MSMTYKVPVVITIRGHIKVNSASAEAAESFLAGRVRYSHSRQDFHVDATEQEVPGWDLSEIKLSCGEAG